MISIGIVQHYQSSDAYEDRNRNRKLVQADRSRPYMTKLGPHLNNHLYLYDRAQPYFFSALITPTALPTHSLSPPPLSRSLAMNSAFASSVV
jgi:hypothetical protein